MYVVNGSDGGQCLVAVRLIVGVLCLERLLRDVLLHNIAIIAQFTCAPREVKNRYLVFFFFYFFFLFFSSGPSAIVSYLLTLVYCKSDPFSSATCRVLMVSR